MNTYKTIQQTNCVEQDIKKSRFICQLYRINSEEEAKKLITQIKKEHYKANHSCSAMIIGERGDLKRSSDDGEPSGTAGVPMLTVLEKQGLTNVLAVVTRYFGGIKLGAGGLIRAYAGSVAHAIEETGIVEVKELDGFEISLTYPQYQTLDNFLKEEGLQVFDTTFGATITCNLFLDKESVPSVLHRLTNFYKGKVTTKTIGKKIVEIPLSSRHIKNN